MVRKYRDKMWLKKKYVEEGLEQQEIADICGVNQATVSKYIQRNNLQKNDKVQCPNCSSEFSSIGRHWTNKPTHMPSLTEKEDEMLTGILMSDGSVSNKKVFKRCGSQSNIFHRPSFLTRRIPLAVLIKYRTSPCSYEIHI